MEILYVILDVAIYSVLGVILMILGNFLIDLVVPCDFPTEIQKGNQAVGWLTAGSFIGIGTIMRAAVMSPATEAVEETLLQGIGSSVVYFIVGVAFFLLGYMLVGLFNKKYNINEEIGKGNTAAGIMVFGVFVGLGLVISGVIC